MFSRRTKIWANICYHVYWANLQQGNLDFYRRSFPDQNDTVTEGLISYHKDRTKHYRSLL